MRRVAVPLVAVIGGLAVMAGTLLAWVRVAATSGPASVAGVRIPFSSQSDAVAGTDHWTGMLALTAGLVTVVAAAALILDPSHRRRIAATAAAGGVVAVAVAGVAFLVRSDIAEHAAGPFLAGLHQVERLAASVGVPVRVEVSVGSGLYETALGGLVAAGSGTAAVLRGAGRGASRQSR